MRRTKGITLSSAFIVAELGDLPYFTYLFIACVCKSGGGGGTAVGSPRRRAVNEMNVENRRFSKMNCYSNSFN